MEGLIATETAPRCLSRAQVDQYVDQGFVLAKGLLGDEVARVREMVYRLIALSEPPHPRLRWFTGPKPATKADSTNPQYIWKVLDTPLAGDDWFQLMKTPRLLDAVQDLLGPDINFWQGFARLKPRALHAQEGWHQDFSSDRLDVPTLVSALLYLDQMRLDQGATMVYPGTHHKLLPYNENLEVIAPPTNREPVVVEADPGDVLLLHCLAVHRASVNRSEGTKTAVIHCYKSARSVEAQPMSWAFCDLPLRRGGQAV